MADMAYDYERNMTNHPPKNDEVIKTYEALRQDFKNVAAFVDEYCPDSREKSLAFTKLEEALMWAVASIARDGH